MLASQYDGSRLEKCIKRGSLASLVSIHLPCVNGFHASAVATAPAITSTAHVSQHWLETKHSCWTPLLLVKRHQVGCVVRHHFCTYSSEGSHLSLSGEGGDERLQEHSLLFLISASSSTIVFPRSLYPSWKQVMLATLVSSSILHNC